MKNELKHYGVLGMKWGVRRYQNKDGSLTAAGRKRYGEGGTPRYGKSMVSRVGRHMQKERAYQRKLNAIANNKNASKSDIKRVKNRQKHIAKRVGIAASTATASILINDILTGKANPYTYTNKVELTKRLTAIGAMTFATVAKDQTLAKSTANRYTSNGKRRTSKDPIISKEDWIDTVVTTGISMIPIMGDMTKTLRFAAERRAKVQSRVDSWGANILPQKVDNIVWRSSDNTMFVIDNR